MYNQRLEADETDESNNYAEADDDYQRWEDMRDDYYSDSD
jgi:hypothetical protein